MGSSPTSRTTPLQAGVPAPTTAFARRSRLAHRPVHRAAAGPGKARRRARERVAGRDARGQRHVDATARAARSSDASASSRGDSAIDHVGRTARDRVDRRATVRGLGAPGPLVSRREIAAPRRVKLFSCSPRRGLLPDERRWLPVRRRAHRGRRDARHHGRHGPQAATAASRRDRHAGTRRPGRARRSVPRRRRALREVAGRARDPGGTRVRGDHPGERPGARPLRVGVPGTGPGAGHRAGAPRHRRPLDRGVRLLDGEDLRRRLQGAARQRGPARGNRGQGQPGASRSGLEGTALVCARRASTS